MKPRPITDQDRETFPLHRSKIFKCPPGALPGCEDVEVLRTPQVIRIPWTPEGEEFEAIKRGEEVTLWLSIWGNGIPPVDLQVVDSQGNSLRDNGGPPVDPTPIRRKPR